MGRNVSFVIAILLFLPVMLAAGDVPGPEKKAQPRATQIIWSTDKTLGMDFVVEPDEELVINPGVRVFLGADVNITVWGNVTAMGTRASPIVFNWSGQHPNTGSIYMGNAARRSHFSNCSFRNAYVAIYASYSDVDVADCTFSLSQRDGIHVTGADFTIRECSFLNNSIYDPLTTDSAIYLNAATGVVANNYLTGNSNGIFMKENTPVTVRNNTIREGPTDMSFGILLRSGAQASVENNSISGQNDGICSNGSSPVISNNLVENNRRNGILLIYSDESILVSNVIRNNGDEGVEIHTLSDADLRSNTICNNSDNGVLVTAARLLLSANDIFGNLDNGVIVTLGGNVSSSQNRLHGNLHAGIALEDNGSYLNSSRDTILDNMNEGARIETGEAMFENVSIGGSKANLVAAKKSRTGFVNGSMGISSSYDMDINDSLVETLNFTFDSSSVRMAGNEPLLRIRWYLNLKIIDGHKERLADANVTVYDNHGSIWRSGRTDHNGELRWLVVQEKEVWRIGIGGETVWTPHRILVDVPGPGNQTWVVMNQSRDVLMQVDIPNLPPGLLAPIPDLSFPEDTDAYGLLNLSRYFSDEGPLTFKVSFEEDPKSINGVMNGTSMDFFSKMPNWTGRRQFRVMATDEEGLYTESNTFTVEVTPVDDPPVLAPAGPFTIRVNETLTGKLAASDIDDPPGSLKVISHVELPPDVRFQLDPGTGEFTFLSTRVGNYSAIFSVIDPHGLSSERITVSIAVMKRNSPPAFTTTPPANVHACQTYTYQVGFADPDGDKLQLTVWSGPTGLRLIGNTISWTPDRSSPGNASVSLRLEDGVNDAVFQNFVIRVLPVNRPPVAEIINPSDKDIFKEGQSIFFWGRGLDPDGDRMSYAWTIDGKVAGNGTMFNSTLGTGRHSVSFLVSDGSLVAYHNITVTLRGMSEPELTEGRSMTVGGDGWLCATLIAVCSIVAVAFAIRDRLRRA